MRRQHNSSDVPPKRLNCFCFNIFRTNLQSLHSFCDSCIHDGRKSCCSSGQTTVAIPESSKSAWTDFCTYLQRSCTLLIRRVIRYVIPCIHPGRTHLCSHSLTILGAPGVPNCFVLHISNEFQVCNSKYSAKHSLLHIHIHTRMQYTCMQIV